MSDLESKKLDDSELEDVNGGFLLNDLVARSVNGGLNAKLTTLEDWGRDDNEPQTLENNPHKRWKRKNPFFHGSNNNGTSKL